MRMEKAKDSEKDKKAMLFSEAFAEELNELARIITVRKKAEAVEEKARQDILKALKGCKLKKFADNNIQIRIVPSREGFSTINTAELMQKNKNLYEILVRNYPKQVNERKESLWVKISGDAHD